MNAPRNLAACLLVVSCVAGTSQARVYWWQDPVVTHTNGMRLASTTSQRSHNVYWRCDPHHNGYCDGHMYGACKNDLRSVGTRSRQFFRLPAGARPGPVYYGGASSVEGLEAVDAERLGAISFTASGLATSSAPSRAASPASAAALPPSATWLEELRRLDDRMPAPAGDSLP